MQDILQTKSRWWWHWAHLNTLTLSCSWITHTYTSYTAWKWTIIPPSIAAAINQIIFWAMAHFSHWACPWTMARRSLKLVIIELPRKCVCLKSEHVSTVVMLRAATTVKYLSWPVHRGFRFLAPRIASRLHCSEINIQHSAFVSQW
jgi:hypothetical protein